MTMKKKWEKIRKDPDQYKERIPSITWPAASEPTARAG
jgi:hypothetical protein